MLPSSVYLTWLLFFCYCVIGWVVECAYCSIPAGHFINRGFLNGPYLPIYGSGSIAGLALFGHMTNPVAIFCLGGALCCALEWVTSYTMEKIYHARWWDYSDKPLNFQGRFWAGGFVEFGVGICVVVLVANPPLAEALESLPKALAMTLALASFACMSTDLVITHIGVSKMRDKMDALVDETRVKAEELRAEVGTRAAELRTEAQAQAEELRVGAEQRVLEYQAEAAERADQLDRQRRQLRAELLARQEAWEQALDWYLGARLRAAGERVRANAPDLPDLPQVPALDEVAERFRARLNNQERRVLEAFPKMRPSDYRALARELADRFK